MPPALPLSINRSEAGLTLNWSHGILQSGTVLGPDGQAGDWSDLADAASPYTLSPTNALDFFRVRIP